jgi:hypothetical protein
MRASARPRLPNWIARLTATTLTALFAGWALGCQFMVMTPANARGGFGVFEPELRYVHDKLYATIVVPEGYGPVETRLVGPGAPSTSLTLTKTCDSAPKDTIKHTNDACAFDLPHADARAGTYTIELSWRGQKLRETSFALVSVPGAGGTKALIVDPAPRVGPAYVSSYMNGFVFCTWLPIDASYIFRDVTFFVVEDGAMGPGPAGVEQLESRRIKQEGDPAVDLGMTSIRLRDLRFDDHTLHALQVIAMVGHRRVGSWALRYGHVAQDPRMQDVMVVTGARTFGPFIVADDAAVDPALQSKVDEAQQKLLDSRHPDRDAVLRPATSYEKNVVPRVCAVLSDGRALGLAEDLDTMRASGHGALATQDSVSIGTVSVGGSSYDVSASTGSGAMIMGLPLWENGYTDGLDTWNALKFRGNAGDLKYAAKLRQLDGVASRYSAGCMAKILGDVKWVLPAPGSDEHEKPRTY